MGGVKQNISDEERERRRQRMLDLRKRLAQVKEQSTEQIIKQKKDKLEKKEKKEKAKPKPEPIQEESETESDSSVSSVEEVKPKAKAKPIMKVNHQKKKGMVRKVVKIKYYDDVTDEQIEADNRFLEGIHKVDAETSHKKKKSKQLKENDEPKQLKEQPELSPETNNLVIDPKQEKINRQMKELFG